MLDEDTYTRSYGAVFMRSASRALSAVDRKYASVHESPVARLIAPTVPQPGGDGELEVAD
jgi:hypothetical protein